MMKFWVLPVLLAVTLLGTSLLGCTQARPIGRIRHTWDNNLFPLAIQVDSDLGILYRQAIHEAINTWNTDAGVELFEYQEFDIESVIIENQLLEPPFGHVYIYSQELGRSIHGDRVLGLAQRMYDRQYVISGVIWLDEDLALNETYGTALHELGHILGLEHDAEITSIMYYHPLESSGNISLEDIEYVRAQVRDQPSP